MSNDFLTINNLDSTNFSEVQIDQIFESIYKHIEFLNNKYDVFDKHEKINKLEFKSYFKNREKIKDNKELAQICFDENVIFKNIINEKDKMILALYEDLKIKDNTIKKLLDDISILKKEKQDQEKSFQNIIKDFQFLNEFNSTHLKIENNRDFSSTKNTNENVQNNTSTNYKSEIKESDNYNSNNLSKTSDNKNLFENNQNKNIIVENENFIQQIDLLNKEKNALESQLVIIKLKYAELNSNYGDLQDQKLSLSSKLEEMDQKLILKEELISHLISEKEKEKESFTTRNDEIRKNYENNSGNLISFTQRNLQQEKNNSFSNQPYEHQSAQKIVKRISFNLDDGEKINNLNYNTTIGNDYIDFNNSGYVNTSNGPYLKTEHQQRIDNYKLQQKNQKNKSFGLIGSIKNFFTNEKK